MEDRKFAFGHCRDDRSVQDADADELVGVAAPAIASVSVEDLVLDVLDQGDVATSCVACAISQGCRMIWVAEGQVSPPLTNILALFWRARAAHNATKKNDGTFPRLAYESLDQYGYAPEDEWPYDQSLILTPPPPRLARASFDQKRKIGYYRLSDRASDRRRQMFAAFAQRRPVTLGFDVDDGFIAQNGKKPWTFKGKSQGLHYVVAVGASAAGVTFVNSWSTLWGRRGFGLASWDTVLDPDLTTDPYVITSLPRISGTLPSAKRTAARATAGAS